MVRKHETVGQNAPKSMTAVQIGKRLRHVRKSHKLNADQVAEIIGSSRASVYKYERGLRDLSAGHLHALSCRLGVDPSWLVTGQNQSADQVKTTIDEHQELTSRILDLAREHGHNILHQDASHVARVAMTVHRRARGQGEPTERLEDSVLIELTALHLKGASTADTTNQMC